MKKLLLAVPAAVATVRPVPAAETFADRVPREHAGDHAFANHSGRRYRREAAEDAWMKAIGFFDGSLK